MSHPTCRLSLIASLGAVVLGCQSAAPPDGDAGPASGGGGTTSASSTNASSTTAATTSTSSGGNAPACTIPAQVVGSCGVKDGNGNYASCAVYWGSAFTPAALMAACGTPPTLGQNICPSAGSVGACEATDSVTGLANYYYHPGDGTPANQAQCNANANHVWCTP